MGDFYTQVVGNHLTTSAHIALGSNLGDRRGLIASAVNAIAEADRVRLLRTSSVIETAPACRDQQLLDPGGPYLNAVVEVETSLRPRELLNVCLKIELAHGRRRLIGERWGPRTLDLDLLLYGDHVIDEPSLTVPHPRLHEREFVLRPLAEIAPDVVHPILGCAVQCLLGQIEQARSTR